MPAAVAVSDPIKRLGIAAFDNTQMAGSATALLAGTPFEGDADSLYAVAFARNCSGAGPYCMRLQALSSPIGRSRQCAGLIAGDSR
jgi:hypothetical protein